METKFRNFLNEQMKNTDFRHEYKALEPEMKIIQALIDTRRNSGLTQKKGTYPKSPLIEMVLTSSPLRERISLWSKYTPQ